MDQKGSPQDQSSEFDEENNEQEELYEHYKFTADKGQEVIRIDKF